MFGVDLAEAEDLAVGQIPFQLFAQLPEVADLFVAQGETFLHAEFLNVFHRFNRLGGAVNPEDLLPGIVIHGL